MYKKLKILLPSILLILFGTVQYFEMFPVVDNLIHDHVMISERPPSDTIIIVGIDERSINEIGPWPWPRMFMAEAIEMLTKMDVAAIGINVFYDTPGAFPEYDEHLVIAAQGTDRLVLGGVGNFSDFQNAGELLVIDYFVIPFDDLAEASIVGFSNVRPDEADGIMRRSLTKLRFGDITVHSLPFEVYRTYRRAMGQEPIENIPLDSHGQLPIRFVGGHRSFRSVSLWGVINEEYDPALFRDAIVLIGPYTFGISDDNFRTSIERSSTMHGVELNANIVQTLLEGIFITDAPSWLNLSIMAFLGILLIILFQWLKPLFAFIITAAFIVVQLFGARLAYDHFNIIVSVGISIVFSGLCYITNIAVSIFSVQNEKLQMKDIFGRFVSPEVMNEILEGRVNIHLGGVLKEISVLFVDIRGFTTFSEANPPMVVMEVINRYLRLTSNAIQKNGGTIDKFIGDATMALFNAPVDVSNHALRAVKTAWDMQQEVVDLRREISNEFGVDLQFGIGINTGVAVIGNMGSDFRMDYTAIGDTVNTAARLESNALKGEIVISDATYQQVKDYVKVTEQGYIFLKNKKEEILVYTVDNVLEGGF